MNRHNKMQHAVKQFGRDTSGNAAVDTAFSMILLLMAIFGVIDCSRMAYIDHFLASASSSASRYAMVRGSSWNGASCSSSTSNCTATAGDVSNFVNTLDVTGVSVGKLLVKTTWPGTGPGGTSCDTAFGNNGPGCMVNVQVTYAFNFALPFLPTGAYTLQSSAAQTIVQ